MNTEVKKPWLSRTLWANFAVAAVAFFPGAASFVQSHPLLIVELLACVNFGLRLVSHDKLALQD